MILVYLLNQNEKEFSHFVISFLIYFSGLLIVSFNIQNL